MKKSACFLIGAVLCIGCAQAAIAQTTKPLRHLVYNFTVGIATNTAVSASGIGTGGSGIENYSGGVSDKGTITVDVLQAVNDPKGKALVVSVSEQARGDRSAVPVSCIIYGDGTLLYDANQKVNDEERALLKYLGRDFFDTARLDANNHWQVLKMDRQGRLQDDFTVKSSHDGIYDIEGLTMMKLGGASPVNSTTNTKLIYNANKTVLQSLHLQSMDRQNEGLDKYHTTRTQIDADLASDSM